MRLQRDPAAYRGLHHGFERSDLSLRSAYLFQDLSNAVRPAEELHCRLCAERSQPTEQQHPLSWLDAGQHGNDRVIGGQRMFWTRVNCRLAGLRMMIHDAGEAGSRLLCKVDGRWQHAKRWVLNACTDEDQIALLRFIPRDQLAPL